MTAQTYDLEIEQGSQFRVQIELKQPDGSPMSLAGASAYSQIRKSPRSKNALVDFTTEIPSPVSDGIVIISLTHNQTSDLNFSSALYDVEIEFASGDRKRVLQGSVRLNPEITKI